MHWNPPRVCGNTLTCRGMPRCTQLCLFPIKSLFSISCRYCLDGVSLPATVNARKPPLSKWRRSLLRWMWFASLADVIGKTAGDETGRACSTNGNMCFGVKCARLSHFLLGTPKPPNAAEVFVVIVSLCLDKHVGLDSCTACSHTQTRLEQSWYFKPHVRRSSLSRPSLALF